MTLFILAVVFGLLALVALFWCLVGFSRELNRGRKTVGMVVHIESTMPKASAIRNPANVTEITLHSGRSA